MSEATIDELKNMAGGSLDSVSASILNQYLADAKSQVLDYLAVGHAKFSFLQRIYCMSLLCRFGVFNGGDIQSESVGDVSVTYGSSGGSGDVSEASYKKMFYFELEKILGISRRIL